MNGRFLIVRYTVAILLVLSTAFGMAIETSADAQMASAWNEGAPLTIETSFTFPENPKSQDFRGVWLAGFAGEPGMPPTALSLVWSEQDTGLLPAWGLQLQSDAGLLPADGQARPGTGMLAQSSYRNLLTFKSPTWGHTYRTRFSYDPVSGALAVWVEDETTGEEVFSQQLRVGSTNAALYPAAGASHGMGQFIAISELNVQPVFVPHGLQWDLVEVRDGEPSRAGTTRLFRNMGEAGVRFNFSGPASGALTLLVEKGGETTHLMTVEQPESGAVYPFDLSLLPPGDSRVIVEYTDADRVWFTAARAINTGEIRMRIEPEREVVYAEQDAPSVQGKIWLSADGPVPPFELTVGYDIAIPRGAGPLHIGWQNDQGSLVLTAEGVDVDPVPVPFSLPLDAFSALPTNSEIFVTLTPEVALDMEVVRDNWTHFVVGEREPAFPPVGQYTVLRGDFHIHTTELEGVLTPSERVWEAYLYGYDTIALTDHRSIRAYDQAIGAAEALGMPLIRGMETGLDQREHLIILDIDASYMPSDEHRWSPTPDGPTVYYQDRVREIIELGGMIVYAHPGGQFVPPPPYDHPDAIHGWNPEIAWMVENGYITGVDVRGHHSPERRDAPFRWALEYGLTMFDVSDVHELRNMSAGSTAPLTLVFVEEVSRAGVMDALRNGRTLVWRNKELRGAEAWLKPFFESVVDVSRGEQEERPCLQIENRGALWLNGSIRIDGNDETRDIYLAPYASVCLGLDDEAVQAEITWTNVWSAPDVLFKTVYDLTE